jgi:hypothetical protein
LALSQPISRLTVEERDIRFSTAFLHEVVGLTTVKTHVPNREGSSDQFDHRERATTPASWAVTAASAQGAHGG